MGAWLWYVALDSGIWVSARRSHGPVPALGTLPKVTSSCLLCSSGSMIHMSAISPHLCIFQQRAKSCCGLSRLPFSVLPCLGSGAILWATTITHWGSQPSLPLRTLPQALIQAALSTSRRHISPAKQSMQDKRWRPGHARMDASTSYGVAGCSSR